MDINRLRKNKEEKLNFVIDEKASIYEVLMKMTSALNALGLNVHVTPFKGFNIVSNSDISHLTEPQALTRQRLGVDLNLNGNISYHCQVFENDKFVDFESLYEKEELKKEEIRKEQEKTKEDELDRLLTYEEKVRWFVDNYYETGMEYAIMLDSLKDDDLDNFKWHNDTIQFPKTVRERNEKEA